MKLKLGKKAFFFTLLASTLLIIMFAFVKPTVQSYEQTRFQGKLARLNYYDSNLKEIENSFIPISLIDTTFKSLIVYNQYLVRKEGKFPISIDEVRSNLREIIWNNTVNNLKINDSSVMGGLQYVTDNIMENSSLSVRFDNFEIFLKTAMRINLTLEVLDLSVYQDNSTGPENIGVSLNYSIMFNESPLAVWKENNTINVSVSIKGINDTYYYFNTKSISPVYMVYSPIKQRVWDLTEFKNFLNNREYEYSPKGLSFLQRIANSTENISIHGDNLRKCCGLITVINSSNSFKKDTGNVYYNRSFVDYCYFNNNCSVTKKGYLVNLTSISNSTFPFELHSVQTQFFNIATDIDEVQ